MTLFDMISHECKTRLFRPAALVSFALFAAALIYGAVNGRMERDGRLEVIANHEAEIAAIMERWLAGFKALEEKGTQANVSPWSGSAMDVTFSSVLPPAPLADFAIGQSDLLPYVGALSLWDSDIRLFSRYEFEDPVSLALGAFDLGKAIIFILPLVLIVLAFDVLSAERDANRLGLILAQGARIRSLVWLRVLGRTGVVLSLTFLISFLALMLHGDAQSFGQRLPFFALWMLSAVLYAAFWIAIIAFVASRNRRSEINVMLLLLLWAGFTLILPASVTAAAEMAYPAPSRLTYLADVREVEIETELAESDVVHQFAIDHPDMLIDDASQMPAYVRTAFLVTSTVDKATRQVLTSFENTASQREWTLSLLRYVSPAIIVHGLFNDVAGASSARHRRYMAEARALKAAYSEQVGPYIVAGRRLPLAQVASLPRFHFENERVTVLLNRNAGALLFLALATVLLLFLADRGLHRAGMEA